MKDVYLLIRDYFKMNTSNLTQKYNSELDNYNKDGFLSPVNILNNEEALFHRSELEKAESIIGPLHYKSKVHTILESPYKLATNKIILDIVEKILGPNILLHNTTYIIKEPKSLAHVSWHQDLTYWGFSHDDQVSVWLALSDANELSGAMKMIPGSHKLGRMDHIITEDENNVLHQGQTVRGVDEDRSILCSLLPGQASFHHGWTLHTSQSNQSEDRRIGLNIQYLSTHLKQTKHEDDTAICVRGVDEYKNFKTDLPAKKDLDPLALEKFKYLNDLYKQTAGSQ